MTVVRMMVLHPYCLNKSCWCRLATTVVLYSLYIWKRVSSRGKANSQSQSLSRNTPRSISFPMRPWLLLKIRTQTQRWVWMISWMKIIAPPGSSSSCCCHCLQGFIDGLLSCGSVQGWPFLENYFTVHSLLNTVASILNIRRKCWSDIFETKLLQVTRFLSTGKDRLSRRCSRIWWVSRLSKLSMTEYSSKSNSWLISDSSSSSSLSVIFDSVLLRVIGLFLLCAQENWLKIISWLEKYAANTPKN